MHEHLDRAAADDAPYPADVIRMGVCADEARDLLGRSSYAAEVQRERQSRARESRVDERETVLDDEVSDRAEKSHRVHAGKELHRVNAATRSCAEGDQR